MATDSPAAPAPAHTEVLEQFFAGHITAGQLTQRLHDGRQYAEAPAAGASTASLPAVAPTVRRGPTRRSLSLGTLVAVAAAGGVVAGISIASGARPVGADARASSLRPATAHRHRAHVTKRHAASTAPAAATPARSWVPAAAASATAPRSAAHPAKPTTPKTTKPAKPHAQGSKPTQSPPAPKTTTTGVSSTPAPTSSTPTTPSTGATPPPSGTSTGPTGTPSA